MSTTTGVSLANFSGTIEDSRENDNSVRKMGVKVIQNTRAENSTYTIPKDKSLVIWQFIPDNFVNNDDLFYTMLTAHDRKPEVGEVTATVAFKQKINFGKTKIRIRYKGSDRYLTTINRRFLIIRKRPAASLGRSTECHFILKKGTDHKTVIIESADENETGNGKCLSSSTPILRDWVCFAKNKGSGSPRPSLCWIINKVSPLYDGDVVTFRHGDRYLCNKSETDKPTDVYCLPRRESEWILEVVDSI